MEGNTTVAVLLKRLFLPFEDNDHILESSTSNLGLQPCIPFEIEWISYGACIVILYVIQYSWLWSQVFSVYFIYVDGLALFEYRLIKLF